MVYLRKPGAPDRTRFLPSEATDANACNNVLRGRCELDPCQAIERPALEGLGTLLEHESRIALKVGVIARLTEERNHDQVDCCCWLRLIDCNVGPSPDPRTVS